MGKPDTCETVKNMVKQWCLRNVLILALFCQNCQNGHFMKFLHSQPVKYQKRCSFDRSISDQIKVVVLTN